MDDLKLNSLKQEETMKTRIDLTTFAAIAFVLSSCASITEEETSGEDKPAAITESSSETESDGQDIPASISETESATSGQDRPASISETESATEGEDEPGAISETASSSSSSHQK
jgi:hypothetical protein